MACYYLYIMDGGEEALVDGLALAVAKVLDGIRAQQGISRTKLAKKIGRPQPTINKALGGKRSIGLNDLNLICEGLGVTPYAVISEASRWKEAQR
jgi:transcriptional regulator with XRE-family HTH domain